MKLFIILNDGEMLIKSFTGNITISRCEQYIVISDDEKEYHETYEINEISTLLILR